MAIEYQLKKQLDNIIENAFCDDPKVETYKKFRLKISDRNVRSYSGTYNERTNTIEIVDIRGKEANNISTLLHEVSHRIEKHMYGKTGHQKTFYEIFRKLIHSALDLGYIDKDEMKQMDHRNVDYKKVMKMLDSYVKCEPKIEVLKTKLIEVSNSYSIKDKLRENNYYWNSVSKTWTKEVYNSLINSELKKLESLNIQKSDIEIREMGKMAFKYKGKNVVLSDYPVIIKGGFDIKEFLKKDGYQYDSQNKIWYKNFSSEEEQDIEFKRLGKHYGYYIRK